ncbi:MAG: family 78 glycoside hydrolase catalytic domain [Saprospiraceae bacterium]|nr:family 78 glycoside hydrolase catalytic domain [Saprospiraceae bacterium]
MKIFHIALFVLSSHLVFGQQNDLFTKEWPAYWITHPEVKYQDFNVLHFAKDFDLEHKPGAFTIHVSADNRYKLYVNGKYVGNGPARGDEDNWRYDTYDIAPMLRVGKNRVRAVVWNFGPYRPVFQHGNGTELLIRGNSTAENIINTDASYQVRIVDAYKPLPVQLRTYYVVGPGEIFDAAAFQFDWLENDLKGSSITKAKQGSKGMPLSAIGFYGSRPNKVLIPRTIPMMEEKSQQFEAVRRKSSKQADPYKIAANSTTSILLDQGHLTTAYPVLKFKGGKGAIIRLTYAESLIDDSGVKGNRNEVENKHIIGNKDSILCKGGSDTLTFTTLWWRTFRYVQMDITTGSEPLEIVDFSSVFTAYPLEEKASFASSYAMTDQIWEVGWRTQRLCAAENFFDCPYYEQLQYTGDTRIQNLITRYVSGDTALMRNAVMSYADAHLASGLTQSRYPSNDRQIIPPFSLIWVYMVHDYFILCQDDRTVKNLLPKIQDVLNWFEQRRREDGLNGVLEYWNYVDWVPEWGAGVPPGGKDGGSSIISLQYALALQKAANIYRHFGYIKPAEECVLKAKEIGAQVMKTCFDENRGLIADTPDKKTFSQHQNVLAILTGTVRNNQANALMQKLLTDQQITPVTFYFSYYLFEAMYYLGSNSMIDHLGPWEDMLAKGLTTFAEKPDPTRSDCHAWSSSPLYFYLSGVCGIKSDGPGFSTVKIVPMLGKLEFASASVPHRNGPIKTDFKNDKGKISGTITLPPGLTGTAFINGREWKLESGVTKI